MMNSRKLLLSLFLVGTPAAFALGCQSEGDETETGDGDGDDTTMDAGDGDSSDGGMGPSDVDGSGASTGLGGTSSSDGSGGSTVEEPDEDRSPGCDSAADTATGDWVSLPSISVDGLDRQYWVMLPEGYDPSRAYPLIFLFHGCGNEENNVPMNRVVGSDAILVRATGVRDGTCWNNSDADLEFVVSMIDELEGDYCIDGSRRFAAGYSSGAWLINMLECKRGDLFRATGTVAGGTPGGNNECVGTVARIFVHDTEDMSNNISGNVTERDRLIALNSCDPSDPVDEEPAPCSRYQGCDPEHPIVWCETTGRGHARQDNFAPEAFWNFFQEF